MPTEEFETDNDETNSTAENTEFFLYTYQVTYIDQNGNRKTELIEATHVVTDDDDHVELWWDEVLMLMVQRCALISIRNVALLDMPLVAE